jgi:hypothetical protein
MNTEVLDVQAITIISEDRIDLGPATCNRISHERGSFEQYLNDCMITSGLNYLIDPNFFRLRSPSHLKKYAAMICRISHDIFTTQAANWKLAVYKSLNMMN